MNGGSNIQRNDSEPQLAMKDWRSAVLNQLLPIASVAMLPVVIFVFIDAFNKPGTSFLGIGLLVLFYSSLVFITINHRMTATARSWVLIMLIYLTGVVALWRGGLAGDGRIYLMALAVLSIFLINVGTGIAFAVLSMATFVAFSFLAQTGLLTPGLVYLSNPIDIHDWILNEITLGIMIALMIYISERSSTFQIKTLLQVQETAEKLRVSNQQLEEAKQKLEDTIEWRTAELREANQRLSQMAMFDALTGLPNRSLLYDRLRQTIVFSQRKGLRFAVLFIDLDNFKTVNDTYGHEMGDQLLASVANIFRNTLRESDIIARLSGDEFVIILNDVQSTETVDRLALKILDSFSQPVHVAGTLISTSVSIGGSLYPDHGMDIDTLLQKADMAMYLVKEGNKNGFRFIDKIG
jgi:diguanylate cyclase (GGDEF)-like protein